MASTQVYNEVKTFLTASLAPSEVIDWDQIEPQLEQGNAPFYAIEEVMAFDLAVGFTGQAMCMREEGTLLIHVFTPAPASSNLCRDLAQQVQQRLQFRKFNATRITTVDPPEPLAYNDGLWTVYGVMVDYAVDRHVSTPP